MSTPKRPRRVVSRTVWDKWVRLSQLPFSETVARDLISRGELVTALVKTPGTKRGVRLIEAASLNAYLHRLAAEQRRIRNSESGQRVPKKSP